MKKFLQKQLTAKEAREIAGESYAWCRGNANTFYTVSHDQTRLLTNNCTDLNYLCGQWQPPGYDYVASTYTSRYKITCRYAPTPPPPYDDFDCIGSLIWC